MFQLPILPIHVDEFLVPPNLPHPVLVCDKYVNEKTKGFPLIFAKRHYKIFVQEADFFGKYVAVFTPNYLCK